MNNDQPTKPKKPPKPGEAGEYIPHVNKGIAIVSIVVFMTILVLPTLIWGIISASEAVVNDVVNPIVAKISPENEPEKLEIIKKLNIDTGENRAMATFPTTFDPEKITAQIESWFNDNLPFRSIVYNTYKSTTQIVEKLYEEKADGGHSLREKIMLAFPTASQLRQPDNPVVPPDIGLEVPTDDVTEETLPSDEETLPSYPGGEETVPGGIGGEETIPEHPGGDNPPDFPVDDVPPDFEDTEDTPPPIVIETDEGNDDPEVEVCEHVKGEGYIETPATCTDWGIMAYKCTKCEKVLAREYTAKAQHSKGEGYIETPATCTEWGVMAYKCTACDTVIDREYTAKAQHVKGEGYIETPATCDDYGVMAYACENCEAVLSREYTAKLKHDYVAIGNEEKICGYYYNETYECSLCKDKYSESVLKKHSKGKRIESVQASYSTYGYALVECPDCGGEYRMNIKAKLYDTSVFTPYKRGDKVLEGREKWLFYRLDNSEAYYNGTNLMTNAELSEYVTVMNTLKALCDAKGIQLQICIWPNKDQVYPEFMGTTPVVTEKRVDRLVKYVRENSDVNIIYPIEELKAAKPYFETYFQYDTHWNNAGGFVGYQAMLKSLGLETCDPYNVEMYKFTGGAGSSYKKDPYCGSLSDMLGMAGVNYTGSFNYAVKYRQDVKVDPLVAGWDKNGVQISTANGAFDTRHTTAQNAPNDLNFVMLADSYRVMQLSYLEKDFTDCFLTHRNEVGRTYVQDAIKKADILVLAAVERNETDILRTAKEIIKILSE